jgi:hypothetical protein
MNLEHLKSHVEILKKDEKNSNGYRAYAAYQMLQLTDVMIETYLKDTQHDKGEILLSVFGLLQSLFVAIDALYDLSIGLTKYKYHININTNPKLHELKFIRNDIVGHPTHRTYQNGGIGFSILDCETLTKEFITYNTYVYQKNDLEIKTTKVEFRPLIDAYYEEQEALLKGLLKFIETATEHTQIPEKVYKLFESLNQALLNEVIESFKETYNLDENDHHHRFLWRGQLLNHLIDWNENSRPLNDMISYMAKVQASKMYQIALNLEERTNKDLYIKPPKILISFYRFIRTDEKNLYPLIQNLHDQKHPLFESDLKAILAYNLPKDVAKLLKWFSERTNSDEIYLIGSQLKAYLPKSR